MCTLLIVRVKETVKLSSPSISWMMVITTFHQKMQVHFKVS